MLDAATALGIPPGPLFGRLQRGETVELPDGRSIQSEQVVGPPRAGRRIAVVTDTRPCAGSHRLAEGAHLLVHEATFAADTGSEARAKGHSTTADAARTAASAGAGALTLTHLSPRYESIESLLAEARALFSPAWIAEDGMVVALDREGAIVSVTGQRRR
jgi:ribonuclease Z